MKEFQQIKSECKDTRESERETFHFKFALEPTFLVALLNGFSPLHFQYNYFFSIGYLITVVRML